MDFLPIDNQANARLQYTESYVLPSNTDPLSYHEPSHPAQQPHSDLHPIDPHPLITIHEQPHHEIEHSSSHLSEPHKESEERPTFNQSTIQIHSDYNSSKPTILQSHVQSISSHHFPITEEVNPPVEITAAVHHEEPQINILDDPNTINCHEISESRTSSKPSLHLRNLQQSSVNIILDNDAKHKDHDASIAPHDNASESLRSQILNRHTRNLNKYQVADPILEGLDENIALNEQPIPAYVPPTVSVPHIESTSAHFPNNSKQLLKRNLSGQVLDSSNIMSEVEPHLIESDHPLPNEIAVTPVFLAPSEYHDSLSVNKKSLLKRSIQRRNLEEPLSFSINSYHTQHIEQTHKYPLQRSLLLQKTEPPAVLQLHSSDLEESIIEGSPKPSQKRNLQAKKLAESVPLRIETDLQHSLNSSPKQSLRRSLERRGEESLQINIEDGRSEHLAQRSESIVLKRSIEHKVQQSLILPPDINDAVEHVNELPISNHQIPVPEEQKALDQSIHLSERLQTLSTPKNILPQKRDLRFNHILNVQQPPLSVNEVSHQAINSESHSIIAQPKAQLPQPIPVLYHPEEETFKHIKKEKAFTRNLKPSSQHQPIQSSPAKQQGWNPTKQTFHVFKLSDLDSHSEPISFTKSRISTASTFH